MDFGNTVYLGSPLVGGLGPAWVSKISPNRFEDDGKVS